MIDVKVIEEGNGGDFVLSGNDISVINGFGNMPYLGMFGGNEISTPIIRLENEQSFDWWGNFHLMNNVPEIQFNSATEKTLRNVALTSQGRVLIEQAVKNDLGFMRPFSDQTILISVLSDNKVQILIKLKEPTNLQEKEFIYIWDGTRLDLQA